MIFAISGATGFVGSHLLESLVQDGHEVIGLARSEKKWREFSLPGSPLLGDLSKESICDWVSRLPNDLNCFIHTAGIVHSFEDSIFFDVNTEATISLFEELKKKYETFHFVFISSLAAAGPASNSQGTKESDPLKPTSAYGKSKMRAEEYLSANLPKAWKLTIIRPPMVIGPRDPAVLDIFKMVKSGIILETGINGRSKEYSFVCVYDLVEVIKKSCLNPIEQINTYFSSYPSKSTFEQIVQEVNQALERKKPLTYIPVPFPLIKGLAWLISKVQSLIPSLSAKVRLTPDKCHELKPQAWVCLSESSQEKLQMTYQYNLRDTVKLTLEDYQQRSWL